MKREMAGFRARHFSFETRGSGALHDDLCSNRCYGCAFLRPAEVPPAAVCLRAFTCRTGYHRDGRRWRDARERERSSMSSFARNMQVEATEELQDGADRLRRRGDRDATDSSCCRRKAEFRALAKPVHDDAIAASMLQLEFRFVFRSKRAQALGKIFAANMLRKALDLLLHALGAAGQAAARAGQVLYVADDFRAGAAD